MSDSDSDYELQPRRSIARKSNKINWKVEDDYNDDLDDPDDGNTDDIPEKKEPINVESLEVIEKPKPRKFVPEQSCETPFELPTNEGKRGAKIFLLVGEPCCGKSHFLSYMLRSYAADYDQFFKFGICFSPTAFTGQYSWLPEKSIRKFDPLYFEQYINHLRSKVAEGVKEHGKDFELPNNFIIFDDCLGVLSNGGYSEVGFFENWIATYRHTSTTIFILTQYLAAQRSTSTLLRNCTTHAIMWPQCNANSVDAMHRAFGGIFPNKDQFKTALLSCRDTEFQALLYKKGFISVPESYQRISAGDVKDFKLVF